MRCTRTPTHSLLHTVYHLIWILCINRKIILIASQLWVKWGGGETLLLTARCMSDGAMSAVCAVKLCAEWKNWAIFCFHETWGEWCSAWSGHWCSTGEALGSYWAHSYWKCTQGKMLSRKAPGEMQSWAWVGGVIGWWCTASWLQMVTVLTNSVPNSLIMIPSPFPF